MHYQIFLAEEYISWHPYTETLCHKANHTLGFLKCSMYNLPMYLHKHNYKQPILPMLDYCSSIWDPYHYNAINQLEIIQHRAARFVTNKPWRRDHCDSIIILHELNWLTLQDRRKSNRLMLFFKLVNNFLLLHTTICHLHSSQS